MKSLTKVLSVSGTDFFLDGEPFDLRGVSFFNALFNEAFWKTEQASIGYLKKFQAYGINTLRVWCQWDFYGPNSTFVDVVPGETALYDHRGHLRPLYKDRLGKLLMLADRLGMVVEVCALSRERFLIRDEAHFPYELILHQEIAIEELAKFLLPYRNIIFQIWNECSFEVIRYLNIARSIDPNRIYTNSPGYAGVLGDEEQNTLLDVLTPHTTRTHTGKFWEEAVEEVRYLLEKYKKPVIDDEPARCGLVEHGGIPGGTEPWQHISQMKAVRKLGGYYTYHHDMFQNGYGSPETPPDGVPAPDLFPFHREVFEAIRDCEQP